MAAQYDQTGLASSSRTVNGNIFNVSKLHSTRKVAHVLLRIDNHGRVGGCNQDVPCIACKQAKVFVEQVFKGDFKPELEVV